jgi:hypothetical protein
MRSHGVPNFQDPVVGTGPGGRGISVRVGGGSANSGINPQSPAFQQAQQTCGPLMGGHSAIPAMGGRFAMPAAGGRAAAGATKSSSSAS